MNTRRVLAIPGDHWHQGSEYQQLLESICRKMEMDITSVLDYRDLANQHWNNLDMVILAREGKINPEASEELWYTNEQEQQLAEYLQNGGKLFVLHSGLASYPRQSLFCKMMKGAFLFHPVEHPEFEIVPTGNNDAADLSICLQDEMYFVWTDSANTEILMESRSPDYGRSAAMWRHGYGNGRVFCYTPGHRSEVLKMPVYNQAIEFGFNWLLKK